MSVTVIQSPDNVMPVYNDIVFTVDSTNKAQCSFRYVCDIYIEAVFVERLKLFPDPVTGYASFKVNRVLEDYISYDLHNNLYGSSVFASNSNTCKVYVLKFGEEYDFSAQCDAGTTLTANMTNTSNYYAFNAALQHREWLSWDSTNYNMTTSTCKFLTTIPNQALITLGSQLTFNFIQGGQVFKLRVLTYDSNGALIGTYTYVNTLNAISNSGRKVLTVGVGPENLNNSTLLSGVQPVISATVSYYTVQLTDNSNNPVGEIKRLDIDNRKYKYNTHRLWWLNRLGGFDSYHFNLKDKRKVDSQRTFYNNLKGEFVSGSPSNNWTYAVSDRGKTGLSVNAQGSNTFNSDWLTEAESLWFEELFTTLEVYLSDTNTVDRFCCLDYATTIDASGYQVTIPVSQVYTVGEMVYIDFGIDNYFSYLSAEYEVLEYSNGTITIGLGHTCVGTGSPPSCITLGEYCYDGSVYRLNFNSELDPIIIKTATYEEKIKYRVKNINYDIEIEPAYGINIQRN